MLSLSKKDTSKYKVIPLKQIYFQNGCNNSKFLVLRWHRNMILQGIRYSFLSSENCISLFDNDCLSAIFFKKALASLAFKCSRTSFEPFLFLVFFILCGISKEEYMGDFLYCDSWANRMIMKPLLT